MLVETPPSSGMQTRPVGDICVSACQTGCAPLLASVSAASGSDATRQSQANRSNIRSSGENSLSAIRLATKASPQTTATRTAMQTSAGFIFFLALLVVRLRFAQKISSVQRRVIIDRFQREADIGQHPFDHPAESRVFVAHV